MILNSSENFPTVLSDCPNDGGGTQLLKDNAHCRKQSDYRHGLADCRNISYDCSGAKYDRHTNSSGLEPVEWLFRSNRKKV